METKHNTKWNTWRNILFKSYYVVWKLVGRKYISEQVVAFKSYYVVWKLSFSSIDFVPDDKFKSYYVVWKHISVSGNIFEMNSLNRTM